MEIVKIEGGIIPVVIINIGTIIANHISVIKKNIATLLEQHFFPCMATGNLFRGTTYDNLVNVLQKGIDVEPTDAPAFFSTDFEKALEYGWSSIAGEKMKSILLCYQSSGLESSYIEKPLPISENEKAALLEKYPTFLETKDGLSAWFSKLPMDDFRLGTPNEFYYGYFLPGNPFESLKMIFFIGDYSESEIDLMKIRVKAFKQQGERK